MASEPASICAWGSIAEGGTPSRQRRSAGKQNGRDGFRVREEGTKNPFPRISGTERQCRPFIDSLLLLAPLLRRAFVLVDESMASRCQPCSVSRIELTAAYTHSGYSARSPYLDTKCDPSGHHICIVIAHCSPEPPHSLDLLKCEHAKVPGSGKYIYDSRLRTDTISSLCHRHVKRVCSNCLLDCPSDLDLACRLDTLWESRPGLSDRSCIRPTCNPSLAFSHPPLFEDWRAMKWMLSGDSRRMDSCS